MDNIVGMMFNKNEGDLLAETIHEILPHVDSLFIADDESADDSWGIINSFKRAHPDKIEHVQQKPNPNDRGQTQSLLEEIRKRYKPENTWVQVIDSDMMILDTNIRDAIRDHAVKDVGVTWHILNGIRSSWEGVDTYPYWGAPIKQIMSKGHHMERVLYTYRPLPELKYRRGVWRPWPKGFSKYVGDAILVREVKEETSPLLGHYGFRGPTHFFLKNRHRKFNKYPEWDTSSVESIKKTVFFFNGKAGKTMDMSREGWVKHLDE